MRWAWIVVPGLAVGVGCGSSTADSPGAHGGRDSGGAAATVGGSATGGAGASVGGGGGKSGSAHAGGAAGSPTNGSGGSKGGDDRGPDAAGSGDGDEGGSPASNAGHAGSGAPASGGAAATPGSGGAAGQSATGAGGLAGAGELAGAGGADDTASGTCPAGGVLFVAQDAGDDDRDGSSWGRALRTVRKAVELSAAHCEIWVARGTYAPGDDRGSTFALRDGVTLRGGFAGVESSPAERVLADNPTWLSGEIGDPGSALDNVEHVVTALGAASFDGIGVSGGFAGDDFGSGGCILGSGPLTLTNSAIENCHANYQGGGVFAPDGLVVTASTFEGNSANQGSAIHAGGGTVELSDDRVSNDHGGAAELVLEGFEVKVERLTFAGNTSLHGLQLNASSATVLDSSFSACANTCLTSQGPLLLGGSSFTDSGSGVNDAVATSGPAEIDDCEFTDNHAACIGATGKGPPCPLLVQRSYFVGNEAASGAGIQSFQCSVSVAESDFTSNVVAYDGGAIDFQGPELTISDSSFDGNTAAEAGGAVAAWNGAISVADSSITGNRAATGGALELGEFATTTLTRTRIVANAATESGGAIQMAAGTLDVRDSELSGNSASSAAVLDYPYAAPLITFTNATVAFNTGSYGAALWSGGTMTLANSILWGNAPVDFAPGLTLGGANLLTLGASNVSGTYPALSAFDPRFVDAPTDLRLSASSPCIDTADDESASSADLLGHARYDVPDVPVCPGSAPRCGSTADMGAYEFGE